MQIFGFVVKGAMRQYSVDDKGAEHVVRLSIENWWGSVTVRATSCSPFAQHRCLAGAPIYW